MLERWKDLLSAHLWHPVADPGAKHGCAARAFASLCIVFLLSSLPFRSYLLSCLSPAKRKMHVDNTWKWRVQPKCLSFLPSIVRGLGMKHRSFHCILMPSRANNHLSQPKDASSKT